MDQPKIPLDRLVGASVYASTESDVERKFCEFFFKTRAVFVLSVACRSALFALKETSRFHFFFSFLFLTLCCCVHVSAAIDVFVVRTAGQSSLQKMRPLLTSVAACSLLSLPFLFSLHSLCPEKGKWIFKDFYLFIGSLMASLGFLSRMTDGFHFLSKFCSFHLF